MANTLLDAIRDDFAAGTPLLWLEAEDYGAEVMCGGKPFPWTKPTEFLSSYSQLQNLLKPGIAPVNIGNFLAAWLDANPAALAQMGGKNRIRFATKKLLGMDVPRVIIREIVSALCELSPPPVVLVLPPNGELVDWANRQVNITLAQELSETDIDSVSVYLADFLRAFSGLNIAGVLVRLPRGQGINPEFLELYSPILNVCKHYRWAVGMEVQQPPELRDSNKLLDFLISDVPGASSCILEEDFWNGSEAGGVPEGGFYYARLDARMNPERVLERLATLRIR